MRNHFQIFWIILIWALTVNVFAADKVELVKVNDTIWVHISYFDYNGVPTPSNGLIVNTRDGLVLVDTPWTDIQTQNLIQMARQTFQKGIILTIFTHAHQDRIGGINALPDQHIETMCTADTKNLILAAGYPSPQTIVDENPKTLCIGGVPIELFYPGPAHTKDNIVVYFPQYKILFGGCIVKASNSPNLGNVSDGDPKIYPTTVRKLLDRFSGAEIVIPGHGSWGDIALLQHTLKLAHFP